MVARPGTSEFERLKKEHPERFKPGPGSRDDAIEDNNKTPQPQQPASEPAKKLASEQGMSEAAAQSTIDRYKANPGSEEFKTLNTQQIQQLNEATNIAKDTNLVEVNRQHGGNEFITQAQWDTINKKHPIEADQLKRYGIEEYNKAIKTTSELLDKQAQDRKAVAINKLNKAGVIDKQNSLNIVAAVEAGISLSTMQAAGYDVSKSDINRANKQSAGKLQEKQYENWTADELIHGRTVNGVYYPSPFGVTGGVYQEPPVWVQERISKAVNQAIEDLEPYLKEGYTQADIMAAVQNGVSKKELARMVTSEGQKYIDIVAASEAGKEPELKRAGISASDILTAKMNDSLNRAITGHEQLRPQEEKQLINQMGQQIQQYGDFTKDTSKMIAELGVRMLPVVGTYMEIKDALRDGKITGWEVAIIAANVAADIFTVTAAGAAVGVGARAAIGVSRAARLAGAAQGLKQFAIAEVKAPVMMLRHPLRTATDMVKMAETILRPSKVPLAALETSYSTIRLPVKAFASGGEAMEVRDVATLAAMREGKFTTKFGDIELDLPPARIQSVGDPVAIHTTPDIRPYMEGVTIQAGREGGLFLAPNLHTRFSAASAFGDMPEGGIRGAVIIRDQSILDKLGGSGKVYNNTVEIEALLKAGIELPKPSQTLITRAAGAVGKSDKLTLLVFGKPYTASEIAKLKMWGALDNINQAFNPKAALRSGNALAENYDELNDLRKLASDKYTEADKLKKAGDIERANSIRAEADAVVERAARLANEISSTRSMGLGRLFTAFVGSDIALPRGTTRITQQQYAEFARIINNPEIRDKLAAIRKEVERITREARTDSRGRVEKPEARTDSRGRARTEVTKITRDSRGRFVAERAATLSRGKAPTVTRAAATSRTDRTGRTPGEPRPGEPRKTVERRTAETPPMSGKVRPPGKRQSFENATTRDEAIEIIKKAGGAITWRQGQLGGKDLWYVIKYPYESKKEDFVKMLGNMPPGATKVTGAGSAYLTAQRLYGKAPSHDIKIDMGLMDIDIKAGKDRIAVVKFTSDPKQLTKGNWSISDKTSGVSNKSPFPLDRIQRRGKL